MPKKERDYHILGKFAHKALEDFHRAYIAGSIEPFHKEMGKAFKAAQAEYKEKMTNEMTKECHQILTAYLKLIVSTDSSYNLVKNVIGAEKEFFLPINEDKTIILNGFIDRVQIDDDGILHIADYKTTQKGAKYLRKDSTQLLTYCYALLAENADLAANGKIRASYILLRHNFEWITFEFTIEQILKAKDLYLAYAEKISSEIEYKANPTILCSWCDYLDLCIEGQAKSKPMTIKHGRVNW